MSNDNFDDFEGEGEEGGGFLDHLFNAIGHLGRAQRAAQAKAQADSAARREQRATKFAGGKRIKTFDAAPADPSCCVAKRED